MDNRIKILLSMIKQSLLEPENTSKKLNAMNLIQQGYDYSRSMQLNKQPVVQPNTTLDNPLRQYFDASEHRVIWKWLHYFEIYHRHLSSFISKQPTLLEIGVYGGGSLDMWQDYFNQGCQIIGVDIDQRCQHYANDNISIVIGDQSDRQFWHKFKSQTPELDIVIDDGGHRAFQQIVTLEECLPLIKPGGVYICEDVHGFDNVFLDYIHGLSKTIHSYDEKSQFKVKANAVQQHVQSIHLYPYVVVIQINPLAVMDFVAEKKGAHNEK